MINTTKVFGIGWAKTGTTTLGKCFKILGYVHQGQRLDLVHHLETGNLEPILALARQCESFEDWPWIVLYKQLDLEFPGSKFILTQREAARWITSYQNMLKHQGEANEELNRIRRTLYGLPFPFVSADGLMHRYEKHNAEVLDYFRDRPGTLLTVNWEKGDGWLALCNFLEKPVPDIPFPHENKGKYP